MTKNLRKQIEWHFYNHKADLALRKTDDDVIYSGLTANLNRVGSSFKISNPTEDKAFQIVEMKNWRDWAAVVENVKIAFQFEVQSEIIEDKFHSDFKKRLKYNELVIKYGNGHESVYTYRYNKIMDLALAWAVKFELLEI